MLLVDIFLRTQFAIEYSTQPHGKVLFNRYEINKNSKLLALFQAVKEIYMKRLKDLVPDAHLPPRIGQDRVGLQPSAPLGNTGA